MHRSIFWSFSLFLRAERRYKKRQCGVEWKMVCMTKGALAGFIRLASRQTNKHIAVVTGTVWIHGPLYHSGLVAALVHSRLSEDFILGVVSAGWLSSERYSETMRVAAGGAGHAGSFGGEGVQSTLCESPPHFLNHPPPPCPAASKWQCGLSYFLN